LRFATADYARVTSKEIDITLVLVKLQGPVVLTKSVGTVIVFSWNYLAYSKRDALIYNLLDSNILSNVYI